MSKIMDRLFEGYRKKFIAENAEDWKREYLAEKTDDIRAEAFNSFVEEKANEIYEIRDAVIQVMRLLRPSLPGAVFALDLIRTELLTRENDSILGKLPKPTNAGEKPKIPMGNIKEIPKRIKPKKSER